MIDRDPDERRRQFEAIALPLRGALYNTARRLSANPDDAADAVQETYLRAYRTFDNFRFGTNAKAWLFTILYSVCINRQKKRRREVGPFSVEVLEARYRQIVESPEPPEITERWPDEIEAALRELPEPFRAALLLVDVQELSYEEAAAAMGCPVGTVQSRLFRARRLLFAALEHYARQAGYLRTGDDKP